MAFLLDTHTLLWWLAESERLSPAVYATLADLGQPVFISAASAWEIATKRF
jgi:PIN domain nuclease of toxin-antitoxin system